MLLSSPTNPLVAFRVVLTTGSQDDPPGKEGLAALTAAMVAEGGTKSLTYDQIFDGILPDRGRARWSLPERTHGFFEPGSS